MSFVAFLENAGQDLRYAFRFLRKHPAFTATAVVTLALGIGGNCAIFTVIRSVLLKPLRYHEPDRLIRVTLANPQANSGPGAISLLRYQNLKTARSLTGLGAYFISNENVTLSGGNIEPESLKASRVSANFLDVLGVQPILGRSFLEEEDRRSGRAVALISEPLWVRRFGADPHIAGHTATFDSVPYDIIGVLPRDFSFPFSGVDVWVTRPSEFTGIRPQEWPNAALLIGFGRLKPGASIEQARAELSLLNRGFNAAHPATQVPQTDNIAAVWLRDEIVANVRPALWLLFGAAGFVLLIACANVASLLLARSISRNREFAVRAALGAPRRRIMVQLLAESLCLAMAGGVLGLLVGSIGLKAITSFSAFHLPRAGEIHLDGAVLGFTAVLSMATGIVFGLSPSLRVSRPGLADVLRERGAGNGSAGRRSRFGVNPLGLLVAGQVALSVVLLIGAALLMKSMAHLRGVDPGFRTANLLTMRIPLAPARYDTGPKKVVFYSELVRRLDALLGVRGSAVSLSLPTAPKWASRVQIAEQPSVKVTERPLVELQSVTPGYFQTLGISLRRGRDFVERDNSQEGRSAVAIINETMARRFWPRYPQGPDPVGQHLLTGGSQTGGIEVVGIVADVHEAGPAEAALPEFYFPSYWFPIQTGYLAVRTDGDPLRLVNAVRRQVSAIDRDQAVTGIQTMEDALEGSVGQRRLTLLLLGIFAAMALLLALVGVYGVISYSVEQRTQELGIRRALGAQQSDIIRLVLGQGLGTAVAGAILGIAGAFALTRVMKSLLFEVSATDPWTFAGIALFFVLAGLATAYFPARRATRVDPMTALRIG